jgi:hypothetical protein
MMFMKRKKKAEEALIKRYIVQSWHFAVRSEFGTRSIVLYGTIKIKTKKKLRGLSPQTNYTDGATAACQRS